MCILYVLKRISLTKIPIPPEALGAFTCRAGLLNPNHVYITCQFNYIQVFQVSFIYTRNIRINVSNYLTS